MIARMVKVEIIGPNEQLLETLALLRELGVPDEGGTSVVMLAPPGSVVGYYAAAPTKEELITSWLAAFGG